MEWIAVVLGRRIIGMKGYGGSCRARLQAALVEFCNGHIHMRSPKGGDCTLDDVSGARGGRTDGARTRTFGLGSFVVIAVAVMMLSLAAGGATIA